MTPTSVDTILKHPNSVNFTASVCIKWLGEPVKTEHLTKKVREAKITDPTGTINLSVWDSRIQQIEQKKFYTVTNCKLKQYFAKRIATTVTTTVTKAQEQDISHVKPSEPTKQGVLSRKHLLTTYREIAVALKCRFCHKYGKSHSHLHSKSEALLLTNTRTLPNGTTFMNWNSVLKDLLSHSMPFAFSQCLLM